MSEENKALVHRWVEAWNEGKVEGVDGLVSDTYLRHDPNFPEVRGPEQEKQFMATSLSAFPDLHFTIEDLVAEGDKVVARFTMSATHRGELQGIPPTGKQLTLPVVEIYRIAEGKIEEQWVILDALGMMQQLGVIPEPE